MTATLPTALTYGQVRWRVIALTPDTTTDPDALPDPTAPVGTVTFTPSAPVLLVDGTDPVTVLSSPQTYDLDASGVLRDKSGRDLVTLVSTDAGNPTGWTWTASYKLTGYSRASFSFTLPAGGVVDLTTVAPVPASGGAGIVRGPKGDPGPAGPTGVALRPPTAHVGRPADLTPTVTYYHPPGAQEVVTPGTFTVVPVDAANLRVTFVAPPSGQVYVSLTAAYRNLTTGTLEWWIRDADGFLDATTRVGANSTVNTEATTTVKVAKDSQARPLVPGKTYTFTWCHASGGDNGFTVYGGNYTAAIMRVEPVPHRLTERQVAATTRPVNTYVPLWLSTDRTTLYGANMAGRLAWSTDDGVTWTDHPQALPGHPLGWVRELDNGELALFTGQGNHGAVWISTGWAASKTAATFAKTLDFQGSPPDVDYGAAPAAWSVDAYGPIVLAAEYGPKNGPTDMARYCYLSEDYGKTWRVIFDLAQKRPSDGSLDAHLHGVCYDPWWDAIWLTQGDNTQRGTWVSYDRGATWLEIPVNGKQFTTILAMPECILLGSDIAPDGIYRIPRAAKDAPRIEYAYPVGDGSFGMVANGWYRARDLPDAPVLIAASGANNNPGRVWATYDGYTFREVWTDTVGYQDRGAAQALGPTTAGTYHVYVIADDNTGMQRKHIVLAPV